MVLGWKTNTELGVHQTPELGGAGSPSLLCNAPPSGAGSFLVKTWPTQEPGAMPAKYLPGDNLR